MTYSSDDTRDTFQRMTYSRPFRDTRLDPDSSIVLVDASGVISGKHALQQMRQKGGDVRICAGVHAELLRSKHGSRHHRFLKNYCAINTNHVDRRVRDYLLECATYLPKDYSSRQITRTDYANWERQILSLGRQFPETVRDADIDGTKRGRQRYASLNNLLLAGRDKTEVEELQAFRNQTMQQYHTLLLTHAQNKEEILEELVECVGKAITTIWSEILYGIAIGRRPRDTRRKIEKHFRRSESDQEVLLTAFVEPTQSKILQVYSNDQDHRHLISISKLRSRELPRAPSVPNFGQQKRA